MRGMNSAGLQSNMVGLLAGGVGRPAVNTPFDRPTPGAGFTGVAGRGLW